MPLTKENLKKVICTFLHNTLSKYRPTTLYDLDVIISVGYRVHSPRGIQCQQVHGLCPEDTEDAPVFPFVWEKIEPLIEGLPLVAHNSRFDEGCLKSVFRVYRMDYPDYVFLDTLTASRGHFGQCLLNHQLHTVAEACGFDLRHHHHALADAEACAHIALQLL